MKKNSAAVALGRKGGLKGGVARAARLTPAQRSAGARNAVRARWAKAGKSVAAGQQDSEPVHSSNADTSDRALATMLKRLRTATDLTEIRLLSKKIEQIVFHKQFGNA
jgi:hypothetical protein